MPSSSLVLSTTLADPARLIPGNNFLEDPTHPATRAVPGISTLKTSFYLPTDVRRNIRWTLQGEGAARTWVAGPIYQSEEEGWHHVPSPRTMKRRARAAEKRRERQGWLGSLVETTETLPPL